MPVIQKVITGVIGRDLEHNTLCISLKSQVYLVAQSA